MKSKGCALSGEEQLRNSAGLAKNGIQIMSSSLILPFGWAAEVFQDGTGIQNHKKDKTVPEEKEISGCCSACDLPSTTQVGSTKLMEHLEVMESMASRIPLPYR